MLQPEPIRYRESRAFRMRGPRRPTLRPEPLLIIGIDAVPYSLVARLASEQPAWLRSFRGPAAINSTFPSVTYTAWSNLLAPLGCGKPLGYETRYFDGRRRRLSGGLSLREVPAGWKNVFDWKLDGLVRTALAYGSPRRYSRWEIDRGLAAFARSTAPVFKMYIVSTDGIAHLHGPDALAEVLEAVQQALARFRRRHPGKRFRTVLLSDHGIAGGEPLKNCWPGVRKAVAGAGFRLRRSVGVDQRDVVFNPYGLLTSFVIYSHPHQAQAVAAAAAQASGVDLAVVREGENAWQLLSRRGEARIERRLSGGETQWRYRSVTADVLGYSALARSSGARAEGGWAADGWWFAASRDHYYPDALHRLAQSFDLTTAAPQVICSCLPGYMFGGLKTEYVARATVGRLCWSHGALHRDASLGFMLSDAQDWDAPRMVRAEDALADLVAKTEVQADVS